MNDFFFKKTNGNIKNCKKGKTEKKLYFSNSEIKKQFGFSLHIFPLVKKLTKKKKLLKKTYYVRKIKVVKRERERDSDIE